MGRRLAPRALRWGRVTTLVSMEALLAFAAALLALRLAGALAGRWRARRAPELLAWAASLAAFAAASGALAWGAAAGWDDRAFRAFYLFGGLLTAALLGAGAPPPVREDRHRPIVGDREPRHVPGNEGGGLDVPRHVRRQHGEVRNDVRRPE